MIHINTIKERGVNIWYLKYKAFKYVMKKHPFSWIFNSYRKMDIDLLFRSESKNNESQG